MCKLQSAKYVGATASRGFLKHTRYVFLDVLRRRDMCSCAVHSAQVPHCGLLRTMAWIA